jgi:hypothetical protein
MPGKSKGTIRGRKLTKAQGRLFGTARGFQEKGGATKGTPAAKIAKAIGPKDLHVIAQKPKSGYRKKGK